jgi:hypothetical protein
VEQNRERSNKATTYGKGRNTRQDRVAATLVRLPVSEIHVVGRTLLFTFRTTTFKNNSYVLHIAGSAALCLSRHG